jgi:hypothetical protein
MEVGTAVAVDIAVLAGAITAEAIPAEDVTP